MSLGVVFYTFVIYPRKLAQEFHGFPDNVAAKLRLALWYSEGRHFDAQKALQAYKDALNLAQKNKMDPFGDQYFGLRLKIAAFLEKMTMIPKAIEVLEQDRKHYLRKIESLAEVPEARERRTEILFKAVVLNAKLAEFYSHEVVNNDPAAEECLVWAVTTILEEQRRRDGEEGDKMISSPFMNGEQIGGTLEALANFYEGRKRHFLAAPLYLQALSYSPPDSCHTVILMNNLATSLALQRTPPSPHSPEPSAADQISSGRSWAHRALQTAAKIAPPQRTEECDQGCAVATINLGDLAVLEGDLTEAKRRFEEGRGLSKAIGFHEGVARAEDSLKLIAEKS